MKRTGKKMFEFKLHSPYNAWSYHVPIERVGLNTHKIPLERFIEHEVDLSRIWRIVIAADVNCLGRNGQVRIALKRAKPN